MCDHCRHRDERDRAMWEAIRLGLIGVQRGLGAIIKAVEKRYAAPDERKAA